MGNEMSLSAGPIREGNRGGHGEFTWDQVKQMDYRDRDHYIGHSVMSSAGRWQAHKDVFWYTRSSNKNAYATLDLEISNFKQHEQAIMHNILGMNFTKTSVFNKRFGMPTITTSLKSYNDNKKKAYQSLDEREKKRKKLKVNGLTKKHGL